MKHFFTLLVAFVMLASGASAQQKIGKLEWYDDLGKAHEKAQASNKPIFAFFTGSDWCGWCHKLQRDVFAKESFIKWASENVVLLELDFPRAKQLPQAQMQQNASLQQMLQVRGYPTVWYITLVTDPKTNQMMINPLGSQGYPAGSEPGKEDLKFLTEAKAIVAKMPKK